jgi:hypothetical protein
MASEDIAMDVGSARRKVIYFIFLFVFCISLSGVSVQAQSASGTVIPQEDPILFPAFTTIGFSVIYEGDENENGTAKVEYRKAGEATWREGHPGIRIWHATDFSSGFSGSQNEWSGRLFHLEPGTTYDVQLTIMDPEGVSGENPKAFTVTTRSEPILENRGRIYHVSPDGNDNDDGSASSPLRTIQRAVELVNPGETVLIHAGTYRDTSRSEFLRINKSGTAEAPIIVKAAPGEEVVIDGADPDLAQPGVVTWQASDAGLYWAPLSADPDYVYYEEHFLMPFDSLNNLKTGLYGGDTRTGLFGGWWYDGSANRLYVKIPTNYDQWSGSTINPTNTHIHAVLTDYGIRVSGDHVVVDGLILQHLGTALRLDGADYVVVRNNLMRGNDTGIRASTSASASEGSWSDFALIEGNDISCSPTFFHREWELGHDVIGTSGLSLSSGGNHVIRRNKVHDVENGIFAGAPWGDASTMGNIRYNAGTVMIDNELYRIGDDSFELDGPVYNQVINGNNMHDVFVGISAAPLSVGPLWMVRNTFYLTNRYFPDGSLDLTGTYMFPYGAWKYNTGGRGGGTGPSLIYHNTSVVMLDPASPLKSIAAFSTVWSNTPGFVVKTRNNSWVVNPGNKILWVEKDDIVGDGHPVEIDMDYDNLWVDLSKDSAYYLGISPGNRTNSLQDIQNQYGLEAHGMSVLPAYREPSQSDFSIPEDSPLVDAGIRIPGINDDYRGSAPDIGSYEVGSAGPTPTFADVPFDHWAHDYIEVLYQQGFIAGCSTDPLMYCPGDIMSRAESAVFVERGVHGAEFMPVQPTEQIFADVPLWEWFAKWSTALWEDDYTAGCGTDPLMYCPLQGHTRTEGCVFFLRMLYGTDYVPPDPEGIFSDVSLDGWGAKWIEAAYNAGLIPACEMTPELRFCPDDPLDRAMGAYMMVQAKGFEIP